MDVRTVAVLGSGTMGSGIAQVCAEAGRIDATRQAIVAFAVIDRGIGPSVWDSRHLRVPLLQPCQPGGLDWAGPFRDFALDE